MTKTKMNFLEEYTRFLDLNKGHLSHSALSVYRNFPDELSRKEIRFFASHLETCAICSARLKEIEQVEGSELRAQIRSVTWISSPAFRYSMAAAFVVAFGAGIVFYLQSRSGGGISQPADHSLALQSLDPQRFVSNEILESFISRPVRSASSAMFLSPRNGDTVAIPLTFRWNAAKSARRYTMVVVDNRNVEAWKETTRATSITMEKRLEPGLYYAKLQVDDVLGQVEKFVVLRGER